MKPEEPNKKIASDTDLANLISTGVVRKLNKMDSLPLSSKNDGQAFASIWEELRANSPSVSQTLGDEDIALELLVHEPQNPKNCNSKDQKSIPTNAPCVNLFKDNRKQDEGMKLETIDDLYKLWLLRMMICMAFKMPVVSVWPFML
ncbi:Hypothetical predicted protein [Olea europaea subsp. europaea]|uniref:Uncharacterized protein n=1 Tax=Olea europaea subsp. europaea TaxID=158383 RepID=A0A8S0T214_OLEEU|nr:Hypothetical predicted protein [Olea europaea subsp. europaea]